MLVQTQHRFSVSDYYRMAETGVLRSDARVELLDGRIIDMSPIGPFHGGVVNRLNRFFSLKADGRWTVAVQNAFRLDDFSEPQPDIMLLRPTPDDYTRHHARPSDVFLLIEVADTTLNCDREEKLNAYGRAGVFDVWIVNLNEQTVEIYREPNFTGYGSKLVLRGNDQAVPHAFQDVRLTVSELLKR
jgi:Uma2 family endonuclease